MRRPEIPGATPLGEEISEELRTSSLGEYLEAKTSEGFDWTTLRQSIDEAAVERREADAYGLSLGGGEFLDLDTKERASQYMDEKDWLRSPYFRPTIKFEPMTRVKAQYLAEEYDRRRARDEVIRRSPDSTGRTLLGFGASLLGNLPDPINLLPGLGGAAKAAGFGNAFLRGAGEAVFQNALVDAALIPDLKARGEDVGFMDAVADVAFGSVLGGLSGVGGHWLEGRREARMHATVEQRAAVGRALDIALDDMRRGQSPDVSPLREDLENVRRTLRTAPAHESVDDLTGLLVKEYGEERGGELARVVRETAEARAAEEGITPDEWIRNNVEIRRGEDDDADIFFARAADYESGVVADAKRKHPILDTDDWKAAKTGGDLAAAERVVNELWTQENTSEIRAQLGDSRDVVVISVPSTSEHNALADALGRRLADDLDGTFVRGGEHYQSKHPTEIKKIQPSQRPFKVQEYEALTPDVSWSRGKKVIVAEDILSTGASAKSFVRSLKRQGVEVEAVAGLLGDARLDAEPQMVSKLRKALKTLGSDINAKELAEVLSRGEIRTIMKEINARSSADAKAELIQDLQGLFDRRRSAGEGRARDLPGVSDQGPGAGPVEDPGRGGVRRARGEDPSHARSDQGVQADARASVSASKERVRSWIAPLQSRAGDAPTLVVGSIDELPSHLRRHAEPGVRGVFDVRTGQTWLFADALPDETTALKTWLHENALHRGLRALIPDQERLNHILADVADHFGDEGLRDIADIYGLDLSNFGDRLTAAEEKLAQIAERILADDPLTIQEQALWRRVLDAVKRAIREVAPGLLDISDREIADLIHAAHRTVMDGPESAGSLGRAGELFPPLASRPGSGAIAFGPDGRLHINLLDNPDPRALAEALADALENRPKPQAIDWRTEDRPKPLQPVEDVAPLADEADALAQVKAMHEAGELLDEEADLIGLADETVAKAEQYGDAYLAVVDCIVEAVL